MRESQTLVERCALSPSLRSDVAKAGIGKRGKGRLRLGAVALVDDQKLEVLGACEKGSDDSNDAVRTVPRADDRRGHARALHKLVSKPRSPPRLTKQPAINPVGHFDLTQFYRAASWYRECDSMRGGAMACDDSR